MSALSLRYLLLLCAATCVIALPKGESAASADAITDYAPLPAVCNPWAYLVRPATQISNEEAKYVNNRKIGADQALVEWLSKTNPRFGTKNLPTLALAVSGGGWRSLLTGAGVIQGFDARDSDVSTSGLLQAFTYQSGLSGGSWLLSSQIGNNYPTISYLKDTLWKAAFANSVLEPGNLLAWGPYLRIVKDLLAKYAAGYRPTLIDAWGRLLSYQLLEGPDGGVAKTLSSVRKSDAFRGHSIPFPIITALGVKRWEDHCVPEDEATTYEFNPFEFGSWGSDVSAFVEVNRLGTDMEKGKPAGWTCTSHFDNLGYVLGTSSALFNLACGETPTPQNSTTWLPDTLGRILAYVHQLRNQDKFAVINNPFYKYYSSSGVWNQDNDVQSQKTLDLVDGGEAWQNIPIFPLLEPSRNIGAMIVNDNSADDGNYNGYPNASAIYSTYVQSLNHDFAWRMPYVPKVEKYAEKERQAKPTFFGCDQPDKITIVYLPNAEFSFASGTSTFKATYEEDETEGMIANGVQIASQGGDEGWATCLGCALMGKSGSTLPEECEACFEEYCWRDE